MNTSMNPIAEQAGGVAVSAVKRVIFSMGGKGGVGKTSVMTGLAEWFEENRIPVTLLDLDIENKAKGSLTHFFGGRVPKINIHTPAGLDAFVDILAEDAPAILADMGAGAGQITHDWFDKMYPDVTEVGIVFTAIGVVTSDPASVESVLNWAAALQHRVAYVIVENNLTEHADFTYWRESDQAEEFRKRFQPAILRLDYRLADLENAARNYGVTLGRVAGRTAPAARVAESLAGDAGSKLPAANVRGIRQGEGTASPVKTAVEPIEIRRAEPDLIDRIANALPEEVRAEYYRELRHCRSLPENDEMLRLLRAMQFLVLLIEQAPSRVAEERERLDKLLATAIDNITRMSAASEAWHIALQRKLTALPADIAYGISPEAVAGKINENLRQEFMRSTIPKTADALGAISDRMKNVCSEFSTTADNLGHAYQGAAEDARKAVASLKSEISQAAENAARFTSKLSETFSKAYRWTLVMLAGGALVIGLAIGMMFERWLFFPAGPVVAPAAPVVQSAPQPVQKAPASPKADNKK